MSTPLEDLPSFAETNNIQPPQHDQMVNDMLKDFENPPAQESNINSEMMGYAMDSSQVPPPKMNKNFLEQPHLPVTRPVSGNNGFIDTTSSKTDWILNLIKSPIIVFIICFIISLPQFNRALFSIFPSCLLESGQVNIYGVLLKALIGAILFVIASYFI